MREPFGACVIGSAAFDPNGTNSVIPASSLGDQRGRWTSGRPSCKARTGVASMCRSWLGLLWLVASSVSASSAAAEPTQLDYLAPSSCPDAAKFERELSTRLADTATSTATERALRIRIERIEPDSFVGRIEFLSHPGAYSQRELSAQTCEELTRALALVVAVVWNPDARPAIPDGVEARPQNDEASLPEPPTAASRDARTRRETTEVERPAGLSQPFEGRWFARAWLGLGLDSTALPTTSLMPRLGLAAERSVLPRVLLSVGVSAALPSSESVTVSGVEGNFSFGAARAEGCGAYVLQSRAHFEVCGALEVGRLAGESSVSPRADQAVTWLAPGILGRARVRIAGPVWLQGGAGILWPLRRPIFYVDEPDTSQLALLEVSQSGLAAELAAAVRVP